MKVKIKSWHAIAQWRWDTGNTNADDDDEGDVCGICRVPYEGCCPTCKMPGDDCPLIWGECTHIFHMHCLLQWIGTAASRQQCPMDRRPWVTAERKVDTNTPTIGMLHGDLVARTGMNNKASGLPRKRIFYARLYQPRLL